ncbi:prolyl oligopeptidase family serine peptidase [candidate division GN15 bacterium]|nr:prolyl oligopeptidase family serine peptidase [candidate division GN15 bacterium]
MKRLFTTLAVTVLAAALLSSASLAQTTSKKESLLSKGKYVPDIATFMQIGACMPAGYSWDGEKVFFGSSMSGAPQYYRLNEEGWPYQLTAFEDGTDFMVLSYGADMAIVGASVGGSEQSQLYLMDTKSGRVVPLTNYEDVQFGSVTWAKDDRSIYYRSNEENKRDFFLYQMDITTGDAVKIFGDTTGGVTGYNAIMDLSQDGRHMIVGNFTSNVNNDLYLLDLTTGEYEKLTEDEGDVMYGSATLMPDNTTIWVLCNDNEDGIMRLGKMEVGSSEVEFASDGWLDPQWEVEGLGFSRDYKHMVALQNEEGFIRMHLREVETKKVLPSPPLDGIIGGGYFDENGNVLISFTGPTRAPNVWRWNPATEELTQLTFSMYAGIDRTIFRDPTLVHYESFDGLKIPAFLYLPPDYEEGTPIPFIVHAHGGPESQYRPYFIRNVQYLMLNGYGVLAPNPRGSSGYGRAYMNMDNYKNRKKSLQDYKAGVDWLIANNYTEQGMIGIRGGSYGGYVVMGMITEYPDLFDAAINIVGIVNFKTFLENTKPYRRALRESEYGPLSDPEFLEQVSPIHKADQIKTPLLVIHGENDPRVPVSEARQIISTLEELGQPVDSLIFPDEGHGASKRVNIIAEYRKQVEFFNEHLKGMEPTGAE